MRTIIDMALTALDWFFNAIIVPFFVITGQGLEWLLLRPMVLLHVPVFLQTVIIAVMAGAGSMLIRHLIKVEAREKAFQAKFSRKKEQQREIELLTDWKTRDLLYRTMDNDLDEDFNTYLAQRFAIHTAVYLLPIFLTLSWLDNVLSRERLLELTGSPHVLTLPGNAYGITGLPVASVFLMGYVATLICFFIISKHLGAGEPATTSPID